MFIRGPMAMPLQKTSIHLPGSAGDTTCRCMGNLSDKAMLYLLLAMSCHHLHPKEPILGVSCK